MRNTKTHYTCEIPHKVRGEIQDILLDCHNSKPIWIDDVTVMTFHESLLNKGKFDTETNLIIRVSKNFAEEMKFSDKNEMVTRPLETIDPEKYKIDREICDGNCDHHYTYFLFRINICCSNVDLWEDALLRMISDSFAEREKTGFEKFSCGKIIKGLKVLKSQQFEC